MAVFLYIEGSYNPRRRNSSLDYQSLPQSGWEEASVALEAAARTGSREKRTPRVDWAELLRRTFDFEVFASNT